jgi:hypothetical protein
VSVVFDEYYTDAVFFFSLSRELLYDLKFDRAKHDVPRQSIFSGLTTSERLRETAAKSCMIFVSMGLSVWVSGTLAQLS